MDKDIIRFSPNPNLDTSSFKQKRPYHLARVDAARLLSRLRSSKRNKIAYIDLEIWPSKFVRLSDVAELSKSNETSSFSASVSNGGNAMISIGDGLGVLDVFVDDMHYVMSGKLGALWRADSYLEGVETGPAEPEMMLDKKSEY